MSPDQTVRQHSGLDPLSSANPHVSARCYTYLLRTIGCVDRSGKLPASFGTFELPDSLVGRWFNPLWRLLSGIVGSDRLSPTNKNVAAVAHWRAAQAQPGIQPSI